MKDYANMSDTSLIERLKQDDETAMGELFERYWKKLFVVALNRVKIAESAEECVLDVFTSLWNRRDNLVLSHSLGTYLAVAIKYRALRELANEHRRVATAPLDDFDENPLVPSTMSADDHILEKELLAAIENAVEQLPEKCKLVYRMSAEKGLTYQEIATKLDISEKTVQAHLTKAKKDLRGILRRQFPLFLIVFLL
ncbi:MAG TPA: RNA polymerase sigma-70 factor [Parapedobacter sp.]|uniref:RNA polymerase sigma factor n=1 Tax=Parapedobacter sp. TaxID=1958893 RepID=UPI002B700FDD|nr:RNA polymerase sigma-70 factor [Parapedobacter sp.]HWK56935.1 RNA polymerase sigma-70 factor [Parapedobacter sp.]